MACTTPAADPQSRGPCCRVAATMMSWVGTLPTNIWVRCPRAPCTQQQLTKSDPASKVHLVQCSCCDDSRVELVWSRLQTAARGRQPHRRPSLAASTAGVPATTPPSSRCTPAPRSSPVLLYVLQIAICSMDVVPVVIHFATNPLCRGGRQSSLQKTNPSGTSASSTQR